MTRLRLLAEDEEDLKVISAHLQDAVMRVGDLAYLPKHRRFAALVNRFCWEDCGEANLGARVRAGLHFDGVLKVQSQNVRQDDPDAVAVLLAIEFTPESHGSGIIDLMLCGGGPHHACVGRPQAAPPDTTAPPPRAAARP